METEKKRGRKKKDSTVPPKEPVEKKKRGRKKKWEVETCQKLLNTEDGSEDIISFPQNNQAEKVPTENYDSKNVSFGNLNIIIHSNRESVDTFKYKQSLISNKVEDCKIVYSDTEEDYITDNNSQKFSVVKKQNKIKAMKHFKDVYSTGEEILQSKFRCMYCHHEFSNKPFFLPYDYEQKLQRYKIMGNFCSPNCVKAYSINSKIFCTKIHLVGQMYRSLFSKDYRIKPAPPINILKCYGGTLSIDEFRANFINNIEYSLININCKIKSIEIVEKINNM